MQQNPSPSPTPATPPTIPCQNCNSPIQQSKYPTHFSYCRRNIRKCPKCPHPYDINYYEEHSEQYHASSKCDTCGVMFKAGEIEGHRKGCGPKMILCAFCDNIVPELIYDDHVSACGARTVVCEICGKPVPRRLMKDHEMSCLVSLCANQGRNFQEEKQKQEGMKGSKRVKKDDKRSVAVDIFHDKPQRPQRSRGKTQIDIEQDSRRKKQDRDRQKQKELKQKWEQQNQKKKAKQKADKSKDKDKEIQAVDSINKTKQKIRNDQKEIKEIQLIDLDEDQQKKQMLSKENPKPSQK